MKLIHAAGILCNGYRTGVIGIAAPPWLSARLLSFAALHGIGPDDPATVVVRAVAGMTAVSMLACYIPARPLRCG